MLKRLLKRPMFWSLLALIACAIWPLRPLDRSALFPVQFANGKYGHINADGRLVVAGVWDQAYSFAADGRALVGRDRSFGFIDRDGKLFAPLGEEVSFVQNVFPPVVRWREKMGKISRSGQLVSEQNARVPLWKFQPQKKGLRQGGKIIVDPVWDDIEPFDAANLAAIRKDGKWGFLDRTQKLVIPLEWDEVEPFAKNSLACVRKADRFGFIDLSGKLVIALESETASRFHDNGLALISKNGIYGFIDQTGKIAIPLTYIYASEFDHRGLALVQINDRHGFIDATGAIVIPLQWDGVAQFDDRPSPASSDIEIINQDSQSQSSPVEKPKPAPEWEGLAKVKKNGRYGCINRRGEVIVDPEWDSLSDFNEKGLAKVRRNKKHGLINRKGEIIIPLEWDQELIFDDKQMAVAQQGKKYGFINAVGKIVLPIDHDMLDDRVAETDAKSALLDTHDILRYAYRTPRFDTQDMAIVKRNKKYGFMNRTGKTVLQLIWEDVYRFDDEGMAIVKRNGKYGFINRLGEIVIEPEWDQVSGFGTAGKCHVTKNGKSGCVNRKGDLIIPVEWDSIWPVRGSDLPGMIVIGDDDPLTPDVLQAQKDNKWGYIDWTGNILVAPEWEHVDIRTDAGAEQCCFVVSRNADDGVQPGWAKTARDWFLRMIGRAEQRTTLCHLYATDGRLLWSSDWVSSTFLSLVLAAIAVLVLACDGLAIWRRRRRERIAAK